jgi:DNA-binding transcriptional LysR family regulator
MERNSRLPPLNAIRAFAVAVESRTLQKAGEVLGVTPQAVGQQIRQLEDWLQVALFERKGRSLDPTEAGILLSHFVKSGFGEIAEGIRRVTRASDRDRIGLNASPFFAAHYMMPCLPALREVLPTTVIRLTTMVDLPDFSRDEVDLSVQWGYGEWKGLDARLLLADPKVICCTPALAATLRKPADLGAATLIDAFKSNHLWPDIFRHLGIEGPPQERKIGFDDAASMRRATLQGIGIGLLSEIDADVDLRAGHVVAPLGRHALSGMVPNEIPGFYLVAPRAALKVTTIARLHRWLLARDWKRFAAALPGDPLAE